MEEKLQNFMEDQNAIESSYKDLKVNLCSIYALVSLCRNSNCVAK
jgi:hypothetical protein